jgi:hypothetical protein
MDAILGVLRKCERFLVCSHARPDGDAVGSMLAMGMFIEQLGKHADMVMADRVPDIYQGLPGAEGIRVAQIVHGPYDAAILLECDGLERTGVSGLEQLFLINIDHHASGHERAGTPAGEGRRGQGYARDGELPLHHSADRHRGLLLRLDASLDVWTGSGTGAGGGRPSSDCP